MRSVIDGLIALMLFAVIAGGFVLYYHSQQDERDVAAVQKALDRLHEQAAYHTAVESAMTGRDTLLVHLRAEWFGDRVPTNVLLDDRHPWIDLAPPGDMGVHPPDPVASGRHQAGFWYNPTTGVFRARVSPGPSESQTLSRYNLINGTSLSAFEQIPDPSRTPVAHAPGTTPARQYAAMANRTWSEPAEEDKLVEAIVAVESRSASKAAERAQEAALQMVAEPAESITHVEVLDGDVNRPTLHGR
ncbi:MAG: hypothetical protein ACPGYV_11170 [Phycisphaeraceae bacterium]